MEKMTNKETKKTCAFYKKCRKMKVASELKVKQEGKYSQDDEQKACY